MKTRKKGSENIKDYYVYEHIRLDNNTCFYVGKGHGKRCNYVSRNVHHDRIVSKFGMKVNIVKDNLSEDEAYQLEKELIHHYVFDLGYGIDIIGYNNNPNEKGHLTNHTFGGDGSYGMVHTDEWRKQHSADMSGKNNPMYGINPWETYSEETKKRIKDRLSISNSNKNNPMYGISPKNRMSEKKYDEWLKKTVNRLKSQTGVNNPNYGNKTLHNKIKDNPQLRIKYYSRKGSQNGRAKKVFMYDINKNFLKQFDYIGECCEWIKESFSLSSKIDSIRGSITESIKNKKPYRKMYFSFKEL